VSVANLPLLSAAMVTAFAAALRSVIVTYDGWYTAIYLSEETVDAPRNVPRAMISCALLVTMLYVLINIGFVHALSLPVLAASPLPAADAARLILPEGGAAFVTFLSLLTIMGLINAVMLGAPRILFGVLRDGIANGRALAVSDGGTPRVALLASSLLTVGLVLARTRGQLIDIAAVLYVLDYLSGYASLFVLRWREPDLPRPFRAPFYPWATGFVFVGSIAFLVAAIADNRVTGFGALALIALAAPVGWWLGRDRATAT
jgi:APA family basic amino acid/polyamine antiporter